MVKTKRSTARTALFASASLLLAARGADASIGFTEGAGGINAFVADSAGTVALDCANLWFDANGALVDGDTGAAGAAGGTHAQGYAVNEGTTVPPVDFGDCKVAPGYYMHTDVTSTLVGDGLIIKPAPANHYATGGVVFDAAISGFADTWDGSADLSGTTSGVSVCPGNSGTVTVTGATAIGACKCDAEYKADTNSACVPCPTGTDWISAPSVGSGATYCAALKAGYYGTLGSSADATLLTACPIGGWTSAGLTSGGPTTIADCFQAASGITPDKTMYGKSGDNTNVYLCPTGTVSTVTAAVSTASFCSSIAAGYYGTAGNTGSAHASSLTACPANSDSAESAATTTIGACECAANFYPSSSTCVACASGTTRAGTVSVTGTATCSAAAESAGASTRTAVALAAAAAVPLLL